MALLMANTSNVKEMKNGRPQSVQAPKALPNCAIVTLGDTMEATKAELDHVHAVTAGAAQTAVGKFVIVAPEINVQQYRMIDNDIAKFALEANEVYTAYELQLHDRLEFSADYFASMAGLAVGETVNIAADGKLTAKVDSKAGCLRVVSIREQRLPQMVLPDGSMRPAAVKMVKVEVVK